MLSLMRKYKVNIFHGLMSFGIVLITMLILCALLRITPFGNNTFLMYDLKRQYIDYYSYFKSLLSGQSDLLYSFSTALGSGMVGFEIYYISSPFLLLLGLFPREYLPMGVTIIICIKLAVAAFIMDLFLQYYLKKQATLKLISLDSAKIITGAISWALSSFLFAHSMNMMWIDVVMLLPMFIWTLDRVILYNKKILYVVCVSLMLWLNYYITFQVMIFMLMWTIYRLYCFKIKAFIRPLFRVFIANLIGALIDAVVLIPTALELFDSPKDITQLGLETTGTNLALRNIFSKLPAFSYDYIEARFGWPQIYCGVLIIILFFLFILNKKIDIRERVGITVLLGIIIISFMSDKINLIWHAGMEPSGHPYRQSYIFIFLLVISGSKALMNINAVKERCVYIVLALTLLIFAIGFKLRYEHITKFTIVANCTIILIYAIGTFVFYRIKDKDEKVINIFFATIMMLQLGELCANAGYTYHYQALNATKFDEYYAKVSSTEKAVEYIRSRDEAFYRVENFNPRQQNDSMQYSYNGITHYSSAGKTYVRYFLQRLGFNDDTLYTHYGHDNTKTADLILGVKYLISDDLFKMHDDYILLDDESDKVYENPYYTSVAIMTNGFDTNDISCPSTIITSNNWYEFVPKADPFTLQENIVSRLLGKEYKIFKDAKIDRREYFEVNEENENILNAEFEITAIEDGEMYMYLDGLLGKVQGLTIYENGNLVTTYGNNFCLKVLNLGYMNKGETKLIRIDGGAEDADFGTPIFVTEDSEVLKKVSEELSNNRAELTKERDSYLRIITGDCDGIFLSIPSEKGWKIYVDGKKTEGICIYGALTYIPISDRMSEHLIEMRFFPEGMEIGVVISMLALFAFVIMIVLEKKVTKNEKN